MAQLTYLQFFNKVAENCGLDVVTQLTGLTGINKIIQNSIDDVLVSLGVGNTWKPLEKPVGEIELDDDTQSYACPYDLNRFDSDSFIYEEKYRLRFVDPQELDSLTVEQAKKSGDPAHIWDTMDSGVRVFKVLPVPGAAQDGKIITFKYWTTPSRMDTSAPGDTTWIPEPYDHTVGVNMATVKVMSYMGLSESSFYAQLVHGVRGSNLPGSLTEFTRAYQSPILKRPIVKWSA